MNLYSSCDAHIDSNNRRQLFGYFRIVMVTVFFLTLCACDPGEPAEPAPPLPPTTTKITIDPATSFQEMIGFGGALTWYADRVINSPKKTEITNLIFNDLGTDILRFKNWYYPDNYPTVKSTAVMTDDNSKALWDVTNQLHQTAKQNNSNVKVLLSSWGPPAGLKSNNSTRQGTLKKNTNGLYMYDELATYFTDLLDNLPFNPEYLSIQNEPTYINAGWTTSEWSANESLSLPAYTIAFDKVYEAIKNRTNPPMMIGPESANIAGNTFSSFADALKNNAHLGMYAYHPYNFGSGTNPSQTTAPLTALAAFSNKPNIMTEFSDNLDWLNTAVFINHTLTYANTSAYIYWKLVWATPAPGSPDNGMVSVNAAGDYIVTPFYYVIKHFAKEIEPGYKRIKATTSKSDLFISAFVNPAQNKITLIIINTGSGKTDFDLEITGKTISAVSGTQTVEGKFYQPATFPTATSVTVPSKSISTVVLSL
jgi:O-glycosyl hydrolase